MNLKLGSCFFLLITICVSATAQTYTLEHVEKKGNVFYNKETKTPLTGTLVRLYPNGKPFTKTNFKNGLLNGQAIGFTTDGHMEHLIEYQNDKKHGLFQLYDENGTIRLKATFQEDKLHGLLSPYTPDGLPFFSETYHEGVLQGERSYYNPDGRLQKTCHTDNNPKEICP